LSSILPGLKPDKFWWLAEVKSYQRKSFNGSRVQWEEKDEESAEMGREGTVSFLEQLGAIQRPVSQQDPQISISHT
jgi:hypothetical protein